MRQEFQTLKSASNKLKAKLRNAVCRLPSRLCPKPNQWQPRILEWKSPDLFPTYLLQRSAGPFWKKAKGLREWLVLARLLPTLAPFPKLASRKVPWASLPSNPPLNCRRTASGRYIKSQSLDTFLNKNWINMQSKTMQKRKKMSA